MQRAILLVACLLGLGLAAQALPPPSSSPSVDYIRSGVGIADVTGPAAEVDFMGYAFPGQTGKGIHTRLWSRAFIFEDSTGNRMVYVSMDLCMSMMSFKNGVVEALAKAGYGSIYRHDNVMLSGIHTHSGPGAYSWFLLYDISMFGMNKQHVAAVVAGITQSIINAHNNIADNKPAPIFMMQGLLTNASRNRSPSAYLANPPEERAQYVQWGNDVDFNMTTLRIAGGPGDVSGAGDAIGAISFFATHCTSYHNTNRLVSSDNKGMASLLFEREMNGNDTLPGHGPFIAAFGQSNEGDVSPNTLGAWCNATVGGVYCSDDHSVCNGRNEMCFAVGPAGYEDDMGAVRIIGTNQYLAATNLMKQAPTQGTTIAGKVGSVFKWVNMSAVEVDGKWTNSGKNETTCRPAVGFSFAAGTTDGCGAFNFYQGDNCTSATCFPLWNIIKDFLQKPTKEQIACHHPKPILLDVGEIKPHPWVPSVLPLQIMQIGELVIIAVPSEFTTMAGRRLRNMVRDVFAENGQSVTVVIAGLANTYTQYTTTFEEYQVQRYEGASTLYGPNQLAAYMQEYHALAVALATGTPVDPGYPAYNGTYVPDDLQPGVVVDVVPAGHKFGDVQTDAKPSYTAGQTVNVTFWGGNLRNDFLDGDSFMTVDRQSQSGWTTIATDASWETKVHWERTNKNESMIVCEWDIPEWNTGGTFRITHKGFYKGSASSPNITAYSGVSSSFRVTPLSL